MNQDSYNNYTTIVLNNTIAINNIDLPQRSWTIGMKQSTVGVLKAL